MQFPKGNCGIMEKPVSNFTPPPFCQQGLPPSSFPTFFHMYACLLVHICPCMRCTRVGCTCMCEYVHGKPEVDTENLPQLLSTFPAEAGSSAEPRLSDAASLVSHFALGLMGRLPCPPDFHTGLGI